MFDFNALADELDQHMYQHGLRFSVDFSYLQNDNCGIFDTADAMADHDIDTLELAIELMTDKDL